MSAQLEDVRLAVPPLPPRHVRRPRLIAALDAAAASPLTLVSAGAGAGKTVLLTEWAHHTTDRVAWLTLSVQDVAPTRFWRLVAAALRHARAPSGIASQIAGFPADALSFGSESVADELEGVPPRVTFVIDGAHLIRDPGVLAALDRLVRGGRPRLRLVLLARSDPLLPLHRYRLVGLIREFRGADLALTPDEGAALLTAHHVALLPHEFDRLLARTEGWAAGVRLSAMRMESRACPGELVSDLGLDRGSIGEYLREEVLADQPETVQRILVQTSFLDEVTGPLASAVTGIDRCAQILDELARTNSFVVAIDSAHTRFRYHPLLRDLLRHLLAREAEPGVPALCRRASAWFEVNDDLGKAAYWAQREVDGGHLVRLLTHGALVDAFAHRQDLNAPELSDLASLVRPETESGRGGKRETTEQAVLARVVCAVVSDGQQAMRALAQDKSIDESSSDLLVLATWDVAELILGQKAGQPARVIAAARRLLGRDLQTSRHLSPALRPAVMLAAALASFWDGRHQECAGLLECALGEAEGIRAGALRAEILGALTLMESYWARSKRAEELASHAAGELSAEGLEGPLTLPLAAALRCWMRADLAGLDRAIQQASFKDVVGSDPGFEAALVIMKTSLLIASDEPVEAHALLQKPLRYVPPPLQRTVLDAQRAVIEQMLGRPRAALQVLEPYPTGYELAVSPDTGFGYLVATARARAHLALGHPREAARSVRALLSSTNSHIGRYQIVDGLTCAALIAHSEDDQGQAAEMLIRALQVAGGDIRLPLVGMTDALSGLLKCHPSIAAQWPVALVNGDSAIQDRDLPRRHANPLVALTDRERAVLRFLATGMSTAEIAGELCVSVNTVKTHLAAIYRKLPARKRREAVHRARALELL
jgi:LuxR family maltose regulon positive regulatory protein